MRELGRLQRQMIPLQDDTREQLRRLQRSEKDKRRYIKVTVLLMLDGGFSAEQIAFALGIDDSTVYRHIERYQSATHLGDYLQDNYTRYDGKLSEAQRTELATELRARLYRTAEEIVVFIAERFSIDYTPSGVVPLLKRLGFVYKKTVSVPPKTDASAQRQFLEQLRTIMAAKRQQSVYFCDAMHPQHNTRPSYGWIYRGESVAIRSNAVRQCINLNGAINAEQVSDVVVREDKRIDAESVIALYEQLQQRQPEGRIIVISDNARYYHSRVVKEWVKTSRIEQVFLPSYSPNLNLIERLWKFLRKKVIDTHYYPTLPKFREAIDTFFGNIQQYHAELQTLLTLNFHVP
jgi:transposase